MMNFYELLGVKENVSKKEIKIAYGKMVQKYHCEVKENNYSKVIESLNEAKDTLLDDSKRKEYDSLLEEINHSKQFSIEKEETYSFKIEDYKEAYSDITKRQILLNYLKNGVDSIFLKLFRLLVATLNFFMFVIIKGITFGIVFLIYLAGSFIDKIAGFILIFGILSLFLLAKEKSPNLIPLIPANVESFCILSIIAFIIEMLKYLVLESSFNLYAYWINLENKLFIKILMN